MTLGRNEVLGEVIEATESGWQVRLIASDKTIKVNSPDRFIKKARTIPTTQKEAATETPEAAVATTDAEVAEIEAQIPATLETPLTETVSPQTQGLSGLDASHKVLLEIGTPLNVRQIADAIRERGYAPNLNGKTPQATISSSLQRENKTKLAESRFYRAGKGLYAAYPIQN